MKLNNKAYDILKWIATIVLPALSTMCFTIGSIWSWSCTEQIIGSIAAVDMFLGVVLGISTAQYNKSKDVINSK
jgi:hypothetical protein